MGVVCVHGVGSWRRGQAALDVARCLERAVRARGGSSSRLPRGPETPLPQALPGRSRLGDARPAVPDLRICGLQDDLRFVARFYDGGWDGVLPAPPARSVLHWGLASSPVIAASTAAGFWRDRVWWARQSDDEGPGRGHSLLGAHLRGFGAAVLCLLVVLGGLLLLPAALVPPAVRRELRESAGDAWRYRRGELDAAVVPGLVRLIDRARAECDVVVLAGHSLGAELLQQAVRTMAERDAGDVSPADAVVWVGSGSRLLRRLRRQGHRSDSDRKAAEPMMPVFSVDSPGDPVAAGSTETPARHRRVPLNPRGLRAREHLEYWQKPETGDVLLEAVRSGR